MRGFKRDRGFITFAQNGEHDYLRLAYGLALSLKATQQAVPYLSVIVTPGTEVPDKYRQIFDEVIDVPWSDDAKQSTWKLENEWKVYHVSPYMETIKLDADMLFSAAIDLWWPMLAGQDVLACTTVETYRGEVVSSDFYRKCFTANELPNVYTGFMYFRICDFAQELFDLAQVIFHNWQRFFGEFLEPVTRPQHFSTDVAFALAIKLLGQEGGTFPSLPVPRFVHMKSQLQNWPPEIAGDEDWQRHVAVSLADDLTLKLGRYRQHLPVHYHAKSFLTDRMLACYERYLGL